MGMDFMLCYIHRLEPRRAVYHVQIGLFCYAHLRSAIVFYCIIGFRMFSYSFSFRVYTFSKPGVLLQPL